MASRPYERQVQPGGTARFAEASPNAFGAGFGDTLLDAGTQLHHRAVETRRNEQNASFSVKLEQLKTDTDAFELSMKDGTHQNAMPGGEGHAAQVEQFWDERAQQLIGSVTDDKVRQAAQLRIAEYRGNLASRAMSFEASSRIKKLGEDNTASIGAIANRMRFSDNPSDLGASLDDADEMIAAYTASPDIKDGMRREAQQTIKLAFLRGQVDRNPAVARALIEKGAFADLPPDVIEAELSGVGVQERRIQAEADAAQRLAKADAKQTVDAFLQAGRDGVPQSREQIGRIKGLVQQFGLAGDEYDVAKIETLNNVRTVTRSMLPAQISAQLSDVETRIAKAGDKATPQDVWMRDELRTQLGARRSQIANDPYSYAAQNGITVAPLNWNDPGSIAARKKVNGTLAAAVGRPVPMLQPDEVTDLAARARGGPQQRGEVAAALSWFGGADAMRAAQQVAPKDYALQQSLALTPQLRTELFEGEKLRQGNGALAPQNYIRDRFASRAAVALGELPASYRDGVLAVATNLYAFRAARTGETDFDEALFDDALQDAIDPSGKGGIGEWNGRPVKLPYGMSQQDFDTRLSRIDRINGAFHADKTPIAAAELRRRFTPVASPVPNAYWFVDDRGGYALDRTGNRASIKLGPQ